MQPWTMRKGPAQGPKSTQSHAPVPSVARRCFAYPAALPHPSHTGGRRLAAFSFVVALLVMVFASSAFAEPPSGEPINVEAVADNPVTAHELADRKDERGHDTARVLLICLAVVVVAGLLASRFDKGRSFVLLLAPLLGGCTSAAARDTAEYGLHLLGVILSWGLFGIAFVFLLAALGHVATGKKTTRVVLWDIRDSVADLCKAAEAYERKRDIAPRTHKEWVKVKASLDRLAAIVIADGHNKAGAK